MLAVAAAMVALVRMLWRATRRWESRLATAGCVVAVSLGGLSAFVPNGLFEARPDQLAWSLVVVAGTFEFFRGLLSPSGLSRRRMIVTGLLLTGSVFTKQTTVVPCLLLAIITLLAPIAVDSPTWSWRKWLRSATVLVSFSISSAIFLIALQVASQGYAYDLLINDPQRYPLVHSLQKEANTSLRLLAVPLAALVLLVACTAWSLLTKTERRRHRVLVAVAAVVFAVSPLPSAILAAAKLGGDYNQLVGPVWTMTLGCSVLLLLLRPSVRQLAAAAIACGVLLAGIAPISQIMIDHHLSTPDLSQHALHGRVSTRFSMPR